MSDWKEYALEELCDFQNGFAFKNSDYVDSSENTNEVFRMGYINRGGGFKEDTTPVFVPQNYPKNLDKFILKLNDITIAMTDMKNSMALLGYCARISHNNRFVLNQRVGRIRVVRNDILDPIYLYYYLNSSKQIDYLRANANSGVQVNLSTDTIKKSILKVPNIEKQREIANILFTLDQKIDLNTQINQTLEQIAQALFKSWFVDFEPVRAKIQVLSDGLSLEQAELAAMQAISGKTSEELTALSQTQPDRYAELAETAKAFPCEMVEVDGVEVPKEWEVKRIDEVIQKIPVGKKYSSKTAFSEGLVPILDQGRSGVIGYHNDKPGVKASIEDPIIVFANHTCYMRLISYDFSAIQNVFAFKGKECNLYWLYLATLGKQEFVEYKGHFPDFLIKEIIVPPEELTELFGKYVKESFSKIFINDRENSNLAKIRDLLLPKLLNGGIQNE
ncbi:restriction endonuclease subunit S [Haemophilus parainfluenzae]|jgi:putative type-1 restriction enzyme hindVIIP specificity protein|uniref:restriction endonuclease subunit S n=1 Tax=Haemophilus parainfluenzae TaxID=729 RepID=UPI00066BCC8C|nr:restriction endonuclease subunit S [Haemophilus parainfluenzae]